MYSLCHNLNKKLDQDMGNAGNLVEKLRTLSPEQIFAVEEFVEFLRVRGQDRALAGAAAAASARAFEAVWNNPEDEVYDAI
jgi:hypothetical protein